MSAEIERGPAERLGSCCFERDMKDSSDVLVFYILQIRDTFNCINLQMRDTCIELSDCIMLQ